MSWFALRVKPQHEVAVAEQLKAKSLVEYVPLYWSTRRWVDRVKSSRRPLVPGYVFARFTFEDRLKVLSISSVVSLVSFGGVPCELTEQEIDRVRSIVSSGLRISPWPTLHTGERVRVREGALYGLEGFFVREKTGCRVVVNMELLQRAVAVEVERDLIEPVPGSAEPPRI
jgi:transcriptional antiterminator NusG